MFGYIYKLSHENNIYIGSTINIFERLYSHDHSWKVVNNKFYRYVKTTNGFNDWILEMLEECEFQSIDELRNKEYLYIEQINPNLNTVKSKRTEFFHYGNYKRSG